MSASRGGNYAVTAEGLADFQRELSRAGAEWSKALRTGNKDVADFVVDGGRRELDASGDPVAGHVADLPTAMKARGEGRRAIVKVDAKAKKNAMAIGAVLGSKAFTQFDEYSAPDWVDGLPTGGYGPLEAIREDIDEIVDIYDAMVADLYRRAFPQRRGLF